MVETADGSQEQAAKVSGRNRTLLKLTGGLLIVAIVWLLYWYLYLHNYEYTDDAYANGNMLNINSAISGSVVAFFADDTAFVSEGQLLVQLDETNCRLNYEKELASLASTVLQVRQLYDNVGASQASVQAKRIAVEKARYDFENRSKLIGAKAVSNEEFTHARDTKLIAEADLQQAEAQWQVAKDAAGSTPLLEHPLIAKQKALVRAAYYSLQHCAIYAPSSGYIAQRSVEVGQWVTPTSNMMAIIPVDDMWVDANYKETQLAYMRIGQLASVWFDLYGSKVKFDGKVIGIASGTGGVFSIIPPQNATGNWIKIVQRLPVRIGLEAEQLKKYPLRLGISAGVEVDLANQDLPVLAGKEPVRAVSKTHVFEIDFGPADRLMQEILLQNMLQEE